MFKELFFPVIEKYHKGFLTSEHKHVSDLDYRKIDQDLTASA